MNKLKKYSTFEEMKSDHDKSDVSKEDTIKIENQLHEFVKALNNETKKSIPSTERSRTSEKIFEKLFSYWECLGIIS